MLLDHVSVILGEIEDARPDDHSSYGPGNFVSSTFLRSRTQLNSGTFSESIRYMLHKSTIMRVKGPYEKDDSVVSFLNGRRSVSSIPPIAPRPAYFVYREPEVREGICDISDLGSINLVLSAREVLEAASKMYRSYLENRRLEQKARAAPEWSDWDDVIKESRAEPRPRSLLLADSGL